MAFVIHRPGVHFGDKILGALFVAILNDHNMNAFFFDADPSLCDLVDVPIWDGTDGYEWWRFSYADESRWDGRSIIEKAIDNFRRDFPDTAPLVCQRSAIPVRFRAGKLDPAFDVAMCLESGPWSAYRSWPHKRLLQEELTRRGLTWIDLKSPLLLGNALLDSVSRSRLYVGVETGVSHFVSSVAKKALIIQSGYSNIGFWNIYNYDHLEVECSCRCCFLRAGCKYNHRCMKDISVEQVVEHIISRIRST